MQWDRWKRVKITMSKTIKVYQFYIRDDAMGDAHYAEFVEQYSTKMRHHEDIYYLYGWCTSKETRNSFKAYRDMSIFKLITDEMTEEEFNEFRNRYTDFNLTIQSMFTKFVDDCKLACTVQEMETIYQEYDTMYEKFNELPDADFYNRVFLSLNKESKKALLDSGFRDFMEALIADSNGEPLAMEMDEASVLLTYYGNTFAK